MDDDDIGRAIWRMAHEIVERNHGLDGVVLIGLQTGGVWLAEHLAGTLQEIEGEQPPLGTLDVAFHRDDIGLRPLLPEAPTRIPVNLDGQAVVLVDDVLFTGRTIRAALDALNTYGRPRAGTAVYLRSAHPLAHRLGRRAKLVGNRADRLPLRTVMPLVVQHHPHRPLTQLGGIPR